MDATDETIEEVVNIIFHDIILSILIIDTVGRVTQEIEEFVITLE